MHPGTPCVFYDHFWDQGSLGQAVRKLLKVRRTNGIHARSKVRRLALPLRVRHLSMRSGCLPCDILCDVMTAVVRMP